MLALKKNLKVRLKGANKVAILGIGSELRGDDFAGMFVAGQLKDYLKALKSRIPIKVFLGATAPENMTGEIKRFNPSHVIIIDSAQMGKGAGELNLISLDSENCVSFSTHRMPSRILVDYLSQSLGCQVIMLGIQPKDLDFGKPLSQEVKKSAEKLTHLLKDILLLEAEFS